MENNNNRHETEVRVTISTDPASSKLLRAAFYDMMSGKEPDPRTVFKLVDEIVSELYSHMNINVHDIALYIMALDVIKTGLMTHMQDETDLKLYEFLKNHSTVTTVHAYDQDTEDNDNEDT